MSSGELDMMKSGSREMSNVEAPRTLIGDAKRLDEMILQIEQYVDRVNVTLFSSSEEAVEIQKEPVSVSDWTDSSIKNAIDILRKLERINNLLK